MENTLKNEISLNEIELDETVSVEMYAMNPRRYANAIIENKEGLPESILDLDEVSLRHILNYVNETECDYTGKKTFGDVVISFINSGVYTHAFLSSVFGTREVVKQRKTKNGMTADGDYTEVEEVTEKQYYIKDKRAYAKIEMDAIQNWDTKGLKYISLEVQQTRIGQLSRELVESNILLGIKEAPNHDTKIKYLRMATDVLGMKGKTNLTQINVYKDGGGDKHNQTVVDISGNDNYDLGIGVE